MDKNTIFNLTIWVMRVIIAVIFLQSLFFKFTGAPESVHIFSTVGKAVGLEGLVEPWGRLGLGLAELAASVMLFVHGLLLPGAALSGFIALGAIGAHLFTPLGIEVLDDGATLFYMAVAVLVCAVDIFILTWLKGRKPAEKRS